MLVYLVSWSHDSSLSKGKGRVPKDSSVFGFTVLCRNSSDAMQCLDWYFLHVFKNPLNLDLTDGVVKLTRSSVDSRNFTINYMMMDGIRRPVCLNNLKESLTQLTFNKY